MKTKKKGKKMREKKEAIGLTASFVESVENSV